MKPDREVLQEDRERRDGLGVLVDEVGVVDHQRRRWPMRWSQDRPAIDDCLVDGPRALQERVSVRHIVVDQGFKCRRAHRSRSGWRRGRLRRVTTTP